MRALLEAAAQQTLAYSQSAPDLALTVVIGDDALLQANNLQFLGIDAPTDVLSFPPSIPTRIPTNSTWAIS